MILGPSVSARKPARLTRAKNIVSLMTDFNFYKQTFSITYTRKAKDLHEFRSERLSP